MERMAVLQFILKCSQEIHEEKCSCQVCLPPLIFTNRDPEFYILSCCIAVYVNRDQLTGFGTPWELRFQANYTVLRKGGNVAGYSSIITFVPELQLGMFPNDYSTRQSGEE